MERERKKKKGLEEKICIFSYKNTKADSMPSSAKKRIITLAYQHAALKLYSLFPNRSSHQIIKMWLSCLNSNSSYME